MESKTIAEHMIRGLRQVQDELRAYPDAERIWMTERGVNNSAGNLCLHLVGNLNHFVGAQLGDTGYVRERDLEFSRRDVPLAELIGAVDETVSMLEQVLSGLSPAELDRNVDSPVYGDGVTLGFWLAHLLGHVHYHLGQISYHRRLLSA